MYLTTGARWRPDSSAARAPRALHEASQEAVREPFRTGMSAVGLFCELLDAGEVEEIVLVGFDGFKPGQPKHYFENFEPWHERVLGWFIEDLLKQSNHDPRSEQVTPPPPAFPRE
mmetsp:Transcript_24686/g.78291  ORF Transcript_24686/g.78291 Transcript_24686/m.78291 type:complete len:115 (-) Transcript_24686:446-790(-)